MGNKTSRSVQRFHSLLPSSAEGLIIPLSESWERFPDHSGCWGIAGSLLCGARSHPQQSPHPYRPAIPLLSTDHLLADDTAEDRNLHSLSSIVESIAVEDVAVTFQEEQVQN